MTPRRFSLALRLVAAALALCAGSVAAVTVVLLVRSALG
jgi:hypothetical protein